MPSSVAAPSTPLLRSSLAPVPRTLVDVFNETCATFPDAVALDDGNTVLSYRELQQAARELAARLHHAGVRPGHRVGVQVPSGTCDLYVAIVGTLVAGAAYVPVDFEDPPERAEMVFGEAEVNAVIHSHLRVQPTVGTAPARPGASRPSPRPQAPVQPPTVRLDHDAWIIFTSGSTGKPKGVAVTHRNAAAFVDAEARWFLQDAPLGPGDRVMAGLSVGFDASCEEMWLAWRHGACLVPAPRALVRSGADLGDWLSSRDITVVSTVPTLASLWSAASIAGVRLLILGGEACPPDLRTRLLTPGREVWNTYGPTEATVVACGTPLSADDEVRIGLPLDGWDLVVVDEAGQPVPVGGTGELIIGGVGLARYLDPDKDAEKYAPLPALGWERAYRSGDLVRNDERGLVFLGRADDQVKVGGRRIELGELDRALMDLPQVSAAAATVRRTPAGTPILVGYLLPVVDSTIDLERCYDLLSRTLPAAMVPRLAVVDTLPTRTSGKVDRDALPWPLPTTTRTGPKATLTPEQKWVAGHWESVLGVESVTPSDNFFALGGASLAAAQLVALLRERYPTVTVGDVYGAPKLRGMTRMLRGLNVEERATPREFTPITGVSRWSQTAQVLGLILAQGILGVRWLVFLGALSTILGTWLEVTWAPAVPWPVLGIGALFAFTPPGKLALSAALCRLILFGVQPGTYARGGQVHLRIWFAERVADALGAHSISCAPWMSTYARALGAHIGAGVNLHSLPPVTGLLRLGDYCDVETEVDLSGTWVDGDKVHVGRVSVGKHAMVGSRSTLLPGARVGARATVAAGSCVHGKIPNGQSWAGSPASSTRPPIDPPPAEQAPVTRRWFSIFTLTATAIGGLPLVIAGAAFTLLAWLGRDHTLIQLPALWAWWILPVTTAAMLTYALVVGSVVRLLGVGIHAGFHPVRSRIGWQVWTTERLLDEARTWLFPLYASILTPTWLRLLGAKIGKNVEASTVLMLPKMTTVSAGAFLADDTLVGSYELARGWLRIQPAKIGKKAFLGNSGMTAPGRKVPKHGLVAVLSATPADARPGTSWLGSPPVKLKRTGSDGDTSRTFDPPTRLKVLRAFVELCRLVPCALSFGLAAAVAWGLLAITQHWGFAWALLAMGPLLLGAGMVAGLGAVIAKWLLIGRFTTKDHPLWSGFVWRNELADTFIEVGAAPWLLNVAAGSPVLATWLRTMGAKIGRRAWIETYWLPEADLVRIDHNATVNRGCVVQTHLFHDRVMSCDTVEIGEGATMGPHGVILPAAVIGAGATVGPASLVMRGEQIPARSTWTGNPVAPWARRRRTDVTMHSPASSVRRDPS